MNTEPKKNWPACLGNTVEEIRQTLLADGVKGIPGNRKCCIIARSYVQRFPNGWGAPYVQDLRKYDNNKYTARITFNDCQIMDPQSTPQVAEFAWRFDHGEYPELVAGPLPKKEEVLAKVLATLSQEERLVMGY